MLERRGTVCVSCCVGPGKMSKHGRVIPPRLETKPARSTERLEQLESMYVSASSRQFFYRRVVRRRQSSEWVCVFFCSWDILLCWYS